MTTTIDAQGNANGAYLRVSRKDDHGVWIAIGDNQREREVWFSDDQFEAIIAAFAAVRQEHRTTTEEESIRAATTEQWGEFFKACDACITKTHCAQHGRCLAECVPADLLTV